jgi:hypothetical protein
MPERLRPQGSVDRDAYVVCVLEQLHRALNNRDVFASPSHRWSSPRARLLDGPDRDAVEEDVLAALSLDMPVSEHLAELVRGLDAGWKQLAARLEEAGPEAKVSIAVQDDGRVKLNVDKLGALGEPKSLTDDDGFVTYVRKRLPHPLLHRWQDEAEPLSSAFGYRRTANIRRRNDLPGRRPVARFLATGDAPCTFNPIYGQGMAVAAMSAVVLRETLSDPRRIPTTRRVQQALLTASRQAWGISAGSDRSDAGRGGQGPGLRAGGPRRRLIPAARPGALPR